MGKNVSKPIQIDIFAPELFNFCVSAFCHFFCNLWWGFLKAWHFYFGSFQNSLLCCLLCWKSPLCKLGIFEITMAAFLESFSWDVAATLCWSSIHLHWTRSNCWTNPKTQFQDDRWTGLKLKARSSLLRSKQYRRFCVTRPIVEQKQWILQIADVSVARRNTYHWSRPRLQLSVQTPGIQLCESVPSGGGRGAINTPGWICECVHSRFTVVCECGSQCVRRPQCWSDPEPT